MSHAESSHLSQPERPLAQKITRLERRIRDLERFRPPAAGGSSPLSWTFVDAAWLNAGWELPSVHTSSSVGDDYDLRYAYDQNAFYLNGYLLGNRGSTKIDGATSPYTYSAVGVLSFPPIDGSNIDTFFTRHSMLRSFTYAQVFEGSGPSAGLFHANIIPTVPIQRGSAPNGAWTADMPALIGCSPSDDFILDFWAVLPW